MNFALIGVGGYIAPRHLKAIRDTGNDLVAVTDPFDSVGVLDGYFDNVDYFREFERFDRHVEKLRREGHGRQIQWVSICSPNFLHDAHIRFAMREGADAICEKPLVLNPWNLNMLEDLEKETGRRVFTLLQLRVHPAIVELKKRLDAEPAGKRHLIDLTYITPRGNWYLFSWKGSLEKSGGLATNIGIHFFDLLTWLFGPCQHVSVHYADQKKTGGYFRFESADARWFLSVDKADLTLAPCAPGDSTYRSLTIDGEAVEFSKGFTDLHTVVYEQTLAGNGFTIQDARPSIELAYTVRHAEVVRGDGDQMHEIIRKGLNLK